MTIQPSLLELWKRRFRAQVKAYNTAKRNLDTLTASDTATKAEIREAKEKERLARGIVRGGAQMLTILSRPFDINNKEAIADLEIDYGMPGKRSRELPGTSVSFVKWFESYWGTKLDATDE